MIRSMTAFAAGERQTPQGLLACEIRAVNHRFLELGVRLPEELRTLEPVLRERVGRRVSRGKLDVAFRFRPVQAGADRLVPDKALLEQLGVLATRLSNSFPGMRTEFTDLLRFPGVLEEPAVDHAGLIEEATLLLEEVLGGFVEAREREGAALKTALEQRLDGIEAITGQVRGWLPQIREALAAKLQARVAELPQPLDPGRLEQELVLWLQKIDVDEELVRLDSHVAEARRVLGMGEAVGRRLDFLLQEFNRESNTLGSKSVDTRTTRAAVELKVLIEQIREQVQNIE